MMVLAVFGILSAIVALICLACLLQDTLAGKPRILDPRYHSPRAVNESIDRAREHNTFHEPH